VYYSTVIYSYRWMTCKANCISLTAGLAMCSQMVYLAWMAARRLHSAMPEKHTRLRRAHNAYSKALPFLPYHHLHKPL